MNKGSFILLTVAALALFAFAAVRHSGIFRSSSSRGHRLPEGLRTKAPEAREIAQRNMLASFHEVHEKK